MNIPLYTSTADMYLLLKIKGSSLGIYSLILIQCIIWNKAIILQILGYRKFLVILFIFHSFTALVKIMVTVNKYKMEIDGKITPKPSLTSPLKKKLVSIWQISFSHTVFRHIFTLRDHLYHVDLTKRVTTYFSRYYVWFYVTILMDLLGRFHLKESPSTLNTS